MKSKLENLLIALTLFSWPFNLFLANTKTDFLRYLIPLILLSISYFLYTRKNKFFLLPAIIVPFFEPKLAIFPILFVLTYSLVTKNFKKYIILIILSFVVLAVAWRPFKGQTIFSYDYQARQQVLRNITLYPNVALARVFQNKARVYTDKFISNIFALTDPNNYFFAFHPREIIVTNQNLYKYPFLGIIFLLIGIYFLEKSSNKNFIIASFVSLIISLSLLSTFDRNDFVLWLPISLTVVEGTKRFFAFKNKFVYLFSIIFIVFVLIQLVRNYTAFHI